MMQDIYKDVTVTSKGQLTLPVDIRRALKLGMKRKVRVTVTGEGIVTVKPLPDVMSFFGKLKSNVPYNASEKKKAREAMGRSSLQRD